MIFPSNKIGHWITRINPSLQISFGAKKDTANCIVELQQGVSFIVVVLLGEGSGLGGDGGDGRWVMGLSCRQVVWGRGEGMRCIV